LIISRFYDIKKTITMSNQDSKNLTSLKRYKGKLTQHERVGEGERNKTPSLPGIPREIIADAWNQLLGTKNQAEKTEKDLYVSQEELRQENLKLKRQLRFEGKKLREQRQIGFQESYEVQIKIENLRKQLKEEVLRLGKEVHYLSHEVSALSVEQEPKEVGVYHLNFLEWVMEIISLARKKVHNAATWLVVWKSKSFKQRGMIYGFKGKRGPKSVGAGVHMMIGGEMGSARSGA
jgi:hypothetical protein